MKSRALSVVLAIAALWLFAALLCVGAAIALGDLDVGPRTIWEGP